MTRNPLRRTGLVLLSLLLPLSAQDEKNIRELLRDALYTEEVTRDPEAAAKQYEELLSRHDAQRAFAASALFRLAEVRRKQDRKDEAIALYQKLLARFPEAEAEGKLARENLVALGGKQDAVAGGVKRELTPEERHLRNQQEKIAELAGLVASSPDLLAEKLQDAVAAQYPVVVEFLLSKGVDPGTPGVLAQAAGTGNLAICKLLLQKGKPSPEEAGNALAEAIRSGRMAVLSHLLEQGIDPDTAVPLGSSPRITPLWVAVEANRPEAAKVLLDHGADIDFMVNPSGNPGKNQPAGTALHYVIRMQDALPLFRLLLERGAKPDVPTPEGGITPLHLAVIADEPQSEIMVKELLARGADPNRRSTVEPVQHTIVPVPVLATPFEAALASNATAKLRLMLEKGADLKALDRHGWPPLRHAIAATSPGLARELIAAGADPNAREASGMPMLLAAVIAAIDSEGVGRSAEDHQTARGRHLEMVKVLLDAGADPSAGHQGKTPLDEASDQKNLQPIQELLIAKGAKPDGAMLLKAIKDSKWDVAMRLLDAGAPLPDAATTYPWEAPLYRALHSSGDSMPVFERLIGMGAKLDEEWITSGFRHNFYNQLGASSVIPTSRRPYLFRTFMLPRLEQNGDIHMATHRFESTSLAMLEEAKEQTSRRRSLAELLLSPAEGVTWPWHIAPTDRLIVWRKAGEEWKSVNEFAVLGDEAFPAVEPGDVLELVEDPKVDGRSPVDSRSAPSSELTWSLRKRVSFPVTVEIDGKAREVMLRGDRLVFDPTAPDLVPLGGARKIMQLLWQPEIDLQDFSPTGPQSVLEKIEVLIRRDGWPNIRLPFSSPGKDFDLRAGDRISLEIPEIKPEQAARRRKDRVMVRATNAPFIRHFGNFYLHTSAPDPRTVPTLLQAIAEVTQVHRMQDAPRDPAALPEWLIERDWTLVCLQRPDLSKIRVRRLEADGSEKVITVDLAKIIATTPEGATSEEVRKADMTLQGGDIVEIPVLPADDAKPWSGLTPTEESFFSKALSCRIQVIDRTGDIRVQEIRYRAPKVVGTEAGPVLLPAPDSVSSLAGSTMLISSPTPKVSREGLEDAAIHPSHLFLKEGDRIVYSPSADRPRTRQVAPTR